MCTIGALLDSFDAVARNGECLKNITVFDEYLVDEEVRSDSRRVEQFVTALFYLIAQQNLMGEFECDDLVTISMQQLEELKLQEMMLDAYITGGSDDLLTDVELIRVLFEIVFTGYPCMKVLAYESVVNEGCCYVASKLDFQAIKDSGEDVEIFMRFGGSDGIVVFGVVSRATLSRIECCDLIERGVCDFSFVINDDYRIIIAPVIPAQKGNLQIVSSGIMSSTTNSCATQSSMVESIPVDSDGDMQLFSVDDAVQGIINRSRQPIADDALPYIWQVYSSLLLSFTTNDALAVTVSHIGFVVANGEKLTLKDVVLNRRVKCKLKDLHDAVKDSSVIDKKTRALLIAGLVVDITNGVIKNVEDASDYTYGIMVMKKWLLQAEYVSGHGILSYVCKSALCAMNYAVSDTRLNALFNGYFGAHVKMKDYSLVNYLKRSNSLWSQYAGARFGNVVSAIGRFGPSISIQMQQLLYNSYSHYVAKKGRVYYIRDNIVV